MATEARQSHGPNGGRNMTAAALPGSSGLTLEQLVKAIPGDTRGLLLYGSHARSTSDADSDVDILQLASRSGPTTYIHDVSVARYSTESLLELMTRGSLFARHLVKESKILWDPDGELGRLLESYQAPASYTTTKSAIHEIAAALQLPHNESIERGVHSAALYAARTALYIYSIENNNERYDAAAIAETLGYSTFKLDRREISSESTTRLLDLALRITAEGPTGALPIAEDLESAAVVLASRWPEASHFLASVFDVQRELPYSTLSLPFA